MVRQSGQSLTDIFGIKDKQLNATEVIDSFSFDKEIYKEIYNQSPAIQQSVAEGDEVIRTYPDFAQDLYMSLFKHRPQLMDKEDVKDTHQFNHQLMEEIMETDEFRQLRYKTRLDMISSALGMEVMSEQAVQIIKEYEQQYKDQNGDSPFDNINEDIDNNGTGGDPAPGGEQHGQGQGQGQPGSGDPNGQGSSGGQGGMTQEQAKDYANGQGDGDGQEDPNNQNNNQGGGNHQIDPNALQKAKEQMQQAMQRAMDDVNETRDFLQAWGMESGDSANRVSYEDKKRALQRLRNSNKLRELSDIVGRMKKLAINEQKSKAPDGAESIKSVVTGNEIQAVLPSEKAQLASSNKALKKNFYRKFYQNELLQYDMDVYESQGKGPMIVCVDTSGSMEGHREQWSKAVALSLLEVANKQKRNYACMHYDSRVQHLWEIPYGQLKPNDVFDIAEFFSCGGTNFERPLRKAMEIVQKDKFKKADVVFITDGDCYVDEQFLEEFNELKKQKEFQVYTVLIDMYGGGGESTVKRFSDKILRVSNLADLQNQNQAANIFRSV